MRIQSEAFLQFVHQIFMYGTLESRRGACNVSISSSFRNAIDDRFSLLKRNFISEERKVAIVSIADPPIVTIYGAIPATLSGQ